MTDPRFPAAQHTWRDAQVRLATTKGSTFVDGLDCPCIPGLAVAVAQYLDTGDLTASTFPVVTRVQVIHRPSGAVLQEVETMADAIHRAEVLSTAPVAWASPLPVLAQELRSLTPADKASVAALLPFLWAGRQ